MSDEDYDFEAGFEAASKNACLFLDRLLARLEPRKPLTAQARRSVEAELSVLLESATAPPPLRLMGKHVVVAVAFDPYEGPIKDDGVEDIEINIRDRETDAKIAHLYLEVRDHTDEGEVSREAHLKGFYSDDLWYRLERKQAKD